MTQGRKASTKTTPEKEVRANAQQVFVEHLSNGDTVTNSAKAARIDRTTAYNWRDSDKDFALAWDDALEAGTEKLETEATRRALESSDTLLIFLLKARRPKVYRDRLSAEVTGADGQPLASVVPVINLTVGRDMK